MCAAAQKERDYGVFPPKAAHVWQKSRQGLLFFFRGKASKGQDMQEEDSLFYEQWQDAQKAAQKKQDTHLVQSLQSFVQTEDGQRILSWLLDLTGVFAVSFTGNSSTFFNEGKRFVGIELYKQLMRAEPKILQRLVDYRALQKQKDKNNE